MNDVATSQLNPIALAPLRWNLVVLAGKWDTEIAAAVSHGEKSVSELLSSQRRLAVKHSLAASKSFDALKKTVPLDKRLAQMERSYDNLVFGSQVDRAASLKKRLDPMVESFYKKHLGVHIAASRMSTLRLKASQDSDRASLEIDTRANLLSLKTAKDRDIKFAKRNNKRSSDEPFGLHFAAASGEVTRIDVMLKRHSVYINVDKRDPDSGWTALHFASRGGHVAAATQLLGAKANVNAIGPNGETPLHLAAGWGTVEIVGLLLQTGADKNMKDKNGKTPLDAATANCRTEIGAFLKRWLPVGLSYDEQSALSKPPPKAYSSEFDPRIAVQLRALEMKINKYGSEHISLTHSYGKLSDMYRNSVPPRFEEAIDAGKRIVAILQRHASGPDPDDEGGGGGGGGGASDHPPLTAAEQEKLSTDVAAALNNLGEISHAAGKSDAKRYFTGSLELMERLKGKSHLSTIPVLRNLALHLLDVGEVEQSVVLLKRYLASQTAVHTVEMGARSMALVETLDLVAFACTLMKDFKSSMRYYDKGTEIVLFHYGPAHILMAERHDKKGFILFCDGELDECQKEYLNAKKILSAHGADEFDDTLMRLDNNIAVATCAKRPVF